jgi:hypothetical protein
LIDLVSNQSGFFLKDREGLEGLEIAAKKILVIGTGGAGDDFPKGLLSDARCKRLNISGFHSIYGLAGAILAEV